VAECGLRGQAADGALTRQGASASLTGCGSILPESSEGRGLPLGFSPRFSEKVTRTRSARLDRGLEVGDTHRLFF